MRSNLKKTLLATAAGVATLVGGHAIASADTVEVQTGDTLSGIAHANNTSTEDLAKTNNITDKNLILAGQKLTVSTPTSSAVSADGMTYTVQTGDTLSKVAQQTGVNIETLSSVNDLSNHDFLLAGQVLALKQAESQNTVPTVTATEQQATTPETTTEQLSYIADADTNKDNFMSVDEYNTYKANGGNTTVAQTSQVQTPAVSQNVKYIAAADTNKDNYMTAAEYAAYQANGGQDQAPAASTVTAPAATEQVTQVSTNTATQTAPAASSDAQALVNSLNAKRASLGLAPVSLDAGLSARAQSRADNAAANGGIPTNHFSTNGEVVANGFSSGSVIDAWFNETNMSTPNGQPGHRMWVANARASSVGFGIVGGIIVGESDAGQF
ncbi:LysM peptidoglycan-binding domain-containing protein [Leuconostoc gelidum subsp. aenigmaticum]|uniref:LysM peptidoglycan-binding domain-containing protein n=1 Tax=Leuconostoc gelidum TaxID=1244 RepID=UPI001CC33AA5|nr:LysM peptidoglycan-binding domain-containing protein [Leuconostoc gelidum]MBZ6004033.1 LysM peptidoglycan-binding domain-containing protein [Leuconostoc gelidum subsp. aenigmaticum]MBZ6007677.1 LysM peptidoglycan-binding domain-containing protein [Leuconostoc gelidum subsp. aenigmaticum]